jgi:hypothetical protein
MGLLSVARRRGKRRPLAAVLIGSIVVVAVMVSIVSFALAGTSSFPDVYTTNPYYAAITALASHDIVSGFANGYFGPSDPVSRQQFAKMVVLAGEYPVSEANVCPFTDVVVSGPSALYPDNYVAVCAARGITVGKTATHFDPYANITRYQAVSMLVRAALDLKPSLLAAPPSYWHGTGAWENDATHGANAAMAEYNGLLTGLDLGSLNPGAYITRGEVAQILYNLMKALTPPSTTTTAHTTTTVVSTTTTSSSTTTTSTTSTTVIGYEVLSTGIAAPPAVASWGPGRLDVFVRGSEGQLLQKYFSDIEWYPLWFDLGGTLAADNRPGAIAGAIHTIDVLVRGTDNSLWQKYYKNSAWSSWENLGGEWTSGPALCSVGAGHLEVLVRGKNGALYDAWTDGNVWSDWTSLGGTMVDGSDPAAVSWGPGRMDVFVRGKDNALWHIAWAGLGWGAWESLGGTLTSSPTVASQSAGSLDVFARGSNNDLWQKSYKQGSWSAWQDLGGGQIFSAPSAIAWGVNRIDVLARGAGNTLYHKWWNGIAWRP